MNFNIYHIINEDTNITINIILLIQSIINIDSSNKIYYYYYTLPENNNLYDYIKKYNNINFIKIDIPERLFKKYKDTYIHKILYENGGIYLNNYVLLLNNIKDINNLNYEYIKSTNNEIIACKKNSQIAFKLYTENNENNLHNENIYIIENNYNSNIDFINEIYDKEIYDYSFGTYFHLIYNCSFFIGNRNIYNIDNLSKITIYNLLIKYILGYQYMYYKLPKLLDDNLHDKYKFINGIDIIYWINLDKSIDRKKNMENILSNFSVPNERISAINGHLDNNIREKYFILTDNSNNYPKYSNTEYAILASHLYTIDKYLENNIYIENGICLICEDDLSLDFIQYWNKSFTDIIKDAPNDWDIIMMGYFSLKLDYDEYTKWNNEWSALSYLVNKNNIKNKINQLKIYDEKLLLNETMNNPLLNETINNNRENIHFKWKCNSNDLMVSDNYIFSKVNTYIYKYPYFTFPNDNDSTLHSDHLNYHKIYKNCNYLIWNKLNIL